MGLDDVGGRTRRWLKLKLRREGVVPIVGIVQSEGGYDGLILAMRERGGLRYEVR